VEYDPARYEAREELQPVNLKGMDYLDIVLYGKE
jgi:hypothetical protein